MRSKHSLRDCCRGLTERGCLVRTWDRVSRVETSDCTTSVPITVSVNLPNLLLADIQSFLIIHLKKIFMTLTKLRIFTRNLRKPTRCKSELILLE